MERKERKKLTEAEMDRLIAEEAEHPYSRWATLPDTTKTISKPTPAQQKLATEINAQRAAAKANQKKT